MAPVTDPGTAAKLPEGQNPASTLASAVVKALPATPDRTLPAMPQRIVLTGFMGSGKSTIGRLLARQLRWRFIDADAAIESHAGKAIATIFADHGEPWFRELEHQTIRRFADSRNPDAHNLVLALGGGAVEDRRTQDLLLQTDGTWVIHLEITFDTVLVRCRGSESVRPVLADRARLEGRYQRRLPLYRESHLTIPVDQLRPPAVLEIILQLLRNAPAPAQSQAPDPAPAKDEPNPSI